MKKILLTISVVLNLVLIMGASFPIRDKKNEIKKPSTCGYTIVEFGKGVDCKGDTIRLIKKNGVQVRAAEAF